MGVSANILDHFRKSGAGKKGWTGKTRRTIVPLNEQVFTRFASRQSLRRVLDTSWPSSCGWPWGSWIAGAFHERCWGASPRNRQNRRIAHPEVFCWNLLNDGCECNPSQTLFWRGWGMLISSFFLKKKLENSKKKKRWKPKTFFNVHRTEESGGLPGSEFFFEGAKW